MKGVGLPVVSLRGVNFGFRSHLGCSGQNAIIFSREGLVQGCTRKNIYCLCFNMVSFRGQKKLEPRPSVSFRGLISSWFNSKFPTSTPNPFICIVSPPPPGSQVFGPTARQPANKAIFYRFPSLRTFCKRAVGILATTTGAMMVGRGGGAVFAG